MRPRRFGRLLTAIALAVTAAARPSAAATLAASGDATISHETDGTWILAAGGAALTLAADSSRDFAVLGCCRRPEKASRKPGCRTR